MSTLDLFNQAFPKRARPYVATIVLTAACVTAYAQFNNRIDNLETYGPPVLRQQLDHIERVLDRVATKNGIDPDRVK